jgi:GNAT superfamily N-acetyltransferase
LRCRLAHRRNVGHGVGVVPRHAGTRAQRRRVSNRRRIAAAQSSLYVFPKCGDEVRGLADTIHDPEIFIKVCAPPAPVQSQLPPHWMIERLGFMMTQLSSAEHGSTLLAGYTLEVSSTPPILIAQVTDSSGLIAAQGRVALVGAFAVYDQIQTHEQHRRRGLGRVVMNALRKTAADHGVDHGLLVATPDGRALYSSLGWQMHSLYTTAAIDSASGRAVRIPLS